MIDIILLSLNAKALPYITFVVKEIDQHIWAVIFYESMLSY